MRTQGLAQHPALGERANVLIIVVVIIMTNDIDFGLRQELGAISKK